MPIQLTREQEDLVQRQMIARGLDNPGQVIDEALRMLSNHNPSPETQLAELREKVQRGLDQIDRGEISHRTIPDIIAECNRQWQEDH